MTFAAPGRAATEPEAHPRPPAEIEFSDLDVRADRVEPTVRMIRNANRPDFESLIPVRRHFDLDLPEGLPPARSEEGAEGGDDEVGHRMPAEGSPPGGGGTGRPERVAAATAVGCAETTIVLDNGAAYTGRYVLQSPDLVIFETCDGQRLSLDPRTIARSVDLDEKEESSSTASTSAPPVVVVNEKPPVVQNNNGCLAAIGAVALAGLIIVGILLCAGGVFA